MTETPIITSPEAARAPVAAIRRAGSFEAVLQPDASWRSGLVQALGLSGLRKLRLEVRITPMEGGLSLTGQLGATIVQPCVVTLDPVTTRIDQTVERRYLEDMPEPEGEEVEMPEDDSLEPLEAVIDLAALLAEVLALNLPLYPRAEGAELGAISAAPEGAAPLSEETAKPFAGLEGLRDKLQDPKPDDTD